MMTAESLVVVTLCKQAGGTMVSIRLSKMRMDRKEATLDLLIKFSTATNTEQDIGNKPRTTTRK
jgi:hypothetical protein